MTGDTASFVREWKKARVTLDNFSSKADNASRKLGQLGRAGAARFTAPITAGLAVGVKSFASFDDALNQSLAIIDKVTDEQRQQLSDLAKQMSGESTFAAKELAEGYFFLASAGLDVEQSIAALPVVTRFAQAGMFSLATATDLLTDAYSALGPQIQETGDLLTDMTKLSDILVKANTLANASVGQFAEALTTEAGTAMRAFRIEVEDGVAVLAAFADQGIKGNVAGSLFARATRLLAKAATENEEAFRKAGIAVFDSEGAFRNFADIAQDLEQRFANMSVEARTGELKLLGFAARTQQAILPLIGMSEKLRELKGELEDAGGKTQEVSDRQLQSFASQMKLVRNEINLAAIALGETLAPQVLTVGKGLVQLAQDFTNLSVSQREFRTNMLLAAAAISLVLIGLGGFIKLLSIAATTVSLLNKAIALLAANPLVALAAIVVFTVTKLFQLGTAIRDVIRAQRTELVNLFKVKEALGEVAAKYGSLENLRRMNRDRWEADAAARDNFNESLQAEIDLQEKLGRLERIAAQGGLSSMVVDAFTQQINALKAELAILAVDEETGFQQTDTDKAAQEQFQKALQDAAFEQLNTEEKINELLEQRFKLQKDISNVQKGSAEFFALREKALEAEVMLRDLVKQRTDEEIESAEAQFKAKRFAGAAEAGSVEAFSAQLRNRGGGQNLERLGKKTNEELEELNNTVRENTTILESAVDILRGTAVTTLSI